MSSKLRKFSWIILMCCGGLVSLALATPAVSAAAGPARLYTTPPDELAGSAAGRLGRTGGLAADPETGHIFVSDRRNNRVSEFDAWGQFVKAWGWGVANGAAELQSCGPGADPPTSTCRQGLRGAGPGQFDNASGGVAVDANGDVWVGDLIQFRVQKFDPDGHFLLMIGGQVNQGPLHSGNVCTATHLAEGDLCGAGVPGSGAGEFENESNIGSVLAAGTDETLYVGDKGRIEYFLLNGSFAGQVELEAAYSGKFISGLARTAAGDFFTLLTNSPIIEPLNFVRKFDSAGELTLTIPTDWTPFSLALDDDENLYVGIGEYFAPGHPSGVVGGFREIIEFSPAGEPLLPLGEGFARRDETSDGEHNYAGLATNVVGEAGETDIYLGDLTEAPAFGKPTLASLSAFGPPPEKWDPPLAPPTIISQYPAAVTETSAFVVAEIDPHFWSDTTYSMEYGTGKCSEGGCTQTVPVPPALLDGGTTNEPVKTTPIEIEGLAPGTVYHFRFRAQSSGGGPVIGVGDAQSEGRFRTRLAFTLNQNCPNQEFRTGPAALLPDCRAYEMVTPLSKNGSGIQAAIQGFLHRVQYNRSSISGDKLTYTSYRAFGNAAGAPYGVQYLATRGSGGWTTDGLSPPRDGTGQEGEVAYYDLETEFRDFSPDLSAAWLENRDNPPLTSDGAIGIVNLYQRDNATDSFRALTNTQPREAFPIEPGQVRYEGHAQNADVTVFSARLALTPDAAEGRKPQLYRASEGDVDLVSVLPDGSAYAEGATLGMSPSGSAWPRIGMLSVEHAVSEDGSTIFWTAVPGGEGPGKLYARLDNSETVLIASGEVAFRKATPTGSEVLYERFPDNGIGNLYKYSLTRKKPELIAGDVRGVLGTSEDLSRIYLVSEEALAAGAEEGALNLLLYEDGEFRFIGKLSRRDLYRDTGSSQGNVSRSPSRRTTRVTSDGEHLAFMSVNPLVGFDNTDQNSGKADAEVYWYSATKDRLVCVSCDPTEVRPAGQPLRIPYTAADELVSPDDWAAAWLTTSDSSFYQPHALSADGQRLFFNSFTPLVAADTNGRQDVYQWEASGSGDCGAPDGCVSLISDGSAPFKSEFVDADPSGDSVFFETAASLVPADPAANDIYVARVGGGIADPPPPPPACEGSACQAPQSAPSVPGALTGSSSAGNLRDAKPSCGKGRRAIRKNDRWRCVPRMKKRGGAKQRSHGSKARTNKSGRGSR